MFLIRKACGKHDLCHQIKSLGKLAAKHLRAYLKAYTAGILSAIKTIEVHVRTDAAGMEIDLCIQTAVAVILCIHIAKQRLKEAHLRHKFLTVIYVKQQIKIYDIIGMNVMVHHRNIFNLALPVIDRRDLLINIFSGKHRDLLQYLLWRRLLLICL